jgi:REP element-mobilizing transposase RayT
MPRNRRRDISSTIHHVIAKGIERRRIFNNDNDYGNFISRLEKSIKQTSAICYAWMLMPNRPHLLIRTSKSSLSDLMGSVLTGYTVYDNKRNKRHGYSKDRQDAKSQAKAIICYLEHREIGVRGIDIAKRFGISNVAVSKNIRSGTTIEREKGINGVETLSS